jgi:hypothetical protein
LVGIARFANGENSAVMRDIIAAFSLPVLVDADDGDGDGDVKNVIRVVQGYEAMGASAIFFEDQLTPKRCGLVGKQVVSSEMHVPRSDLPWPLAIIRKRSSSPARPPAVRLGSMKRRAALSCM